MCPFSRVPTRWALAAALSLAASAVVLAATPASADPTVATLDPGDTLVVSRLSITDGKGWLTLHARNVSATGYEVRVPAGDGSWSGKADVYLPEQDAHCTLQPGLDLDYVCRPSPGETQFPNGGYAVSIPVTRIGSVEGLTGTAWAVDDTSVGYEDTFPVLDGSHYRSTAEVRIAPVTRDADPAYGRATVAVTTTIVPRESITALDVTPPTVTGDYRIIGSNIAGHGVRCSPRWNGSPMIHCFPSDASASGLPAGRYNLVLTIGFLGEQADSYAQVSLTASGLEREVADTFAYVPS